jgi:RHS repeat-associated protein
VNRGGAYSKILRQFIKTPGKYVITGHERDVETGLDYRGARFYDSNVARFLSLDPLAAEFAEWSAYNYVLGNPVMFVDPDGKAPIDPTEAILRLGNIATSMNQMMSETWDNSKELNLEHGFNIFENKKTGDFYKRNTYIEDEKEGEVGVNYEPTFQGSKIHGDYHTHPYTEEQQKKGLVDQAHSFGDITDLNDRRGLNDNYISIVETENKRFALVILDKKKAKKFLKAMAKDEEKAYEKFTPTAGVTTLDDARKSMILNLLGDNSGIGLFETTDAEKTQFQQVTKVELDED